MKQQHSPPSSLRTLIASVSGAYRSNPRQVVFAVGAATSVIAFAVAYWAMRHPAPAPVAPQANTTANITTLSITGNFTASNKVYDGTNKSFFWVAAEAYRQYDASGTRLQVPTALERNGDIGNLNGAGHHTPAYILPGPSTPFGSSAKPPDSLSSSRFWKTFLSGPRSETSQTFSRFFVSS